ncbi:PfkB family carbohydrate kinase [soil metagenome]
MIAVVGDVLLDVVVTPQAAVAAGSDTPSTITWRQGGSAATTAAWLAQMGARVRLVGRVGADAAGAALTTDLRAAGVDAQLTIDPDRPTGTVVALCTPGDQDTSRDRDMYTSRGASAGLGPADLAEGWLADVTHLHLSGYLLLADSTRDAGLAALHQASAAGLAISVDPSSAAPLAAVGADTFTGWLPPGTLLTPNLAEAVVLTGLSDPVAAAVALARRCGEAVVTLGAAGAVWSDGTSTSDATVDPVPDADPVGAGDAFNAGLLAARLRGDDIGGQLAAATRAATRAVRGARPGRTSPASG